MNYYDRGLFKQALPLAEKSYSLAQELLDEKDQFNITIISNLASIYQKLGRFNEALTLFEKAYSLLKEDEPNQFTLLVINNLAGIYRMLARLKEASTILEKIYPLTKTKLGEKHLQTITTLNNFATNDKLMDLVKMSGYVFLLRKKI